MIRVKSTREGGGGKDESARPEFQTDATGARGPLVFGLTLTAVLLYLKSFLPTAEAAERPQDEEEGTPGSEEAAADVGGIPVPVARPKAPDAAPEEEAPAADAKADLPLSATMPAVRWSGASDAGLPNAAFVAPITAAANLPAPPMPWRGPSGFPAEEPAIRFPGLGEVGEGAEPHIELASDPGDDAAETSDDDPPATPPNRGPRNSGPVYLADLGTGAVLFVSLAMLLRQTTDPDGDVLAVTKLQASRGTLVPETGGWTYVPDPDAGPGPVSLRYSISDGTAEVEQFAVFRIMPDTAQGPVPASFVVADAPEDDDIGGDQAVEAVAAADTVEAPLNGSGGIMLRGSEGDDILTGGDGNDTAFGGAGKDVISGRAGNDRLHGEAGDDTLDGGAGDDELAGGSGDDALAGGDGDDTLDGGDGDDRLEDGAGSDVVKGGAGADHIVAAPDGEDDVLSGGEGYDLIDYGADTLGVVFDIAQGVVEGAGVGTDDIDGFEAFAGGQGQDLFLAAGSCGTFTGGEGDDRYVFEEPRLDLDGGALRFQITDFAVGDLISLGAINMFKRTGAKGFDEEDLMEDIYDTLKEYDFGDSRPRLRLREEEADGVERTLIEIDFDRDKTYEMTITLEGGNLIALFDVS